MKEGAEKETDTFSEVLTHSTDKFKDFFDELIVELRTERRKEMWSPSKEGIINVSKKDAGRRPVLRGLRHLRDNLNPVPAMHLSAKETIQSVGKIKQSLRRNVFATPRDLSKFYKHLRDGDDILFGDVVEKAVLGMYQVQNPREHSMLSQLVYLQAFSHVLFPEIKTRRDAHSRMHGPDPDRLDTKNARTLRMLQEDFDFLATLQVTNDYYRMGLRQAHKDTRTDWIMPPFKILDYLSWGEEAKTNAFYDVPAINDLTQYCGSLVNGSNENRGLMHAHRDEYFFLATVSQLLNSHMARLSEVQLFFLKDTVEAIEKLETPPWESFNFARGVPSSQKIFFPENEGAILLCVDPAPNKAYVATVSLTNEGFFQELEQRVGSAKAAREVLNPLTKPFNQGSYVQAINGIAFYVRRKDGELSMYGDSTSLARAQLGEYYEPCRELVQHAVHNLVDTTYIPIDENHTKVTGPEGMIPRPSSQQIPDSPPLRGIPAERIEGEGDERAFSGRSEHARLLPTGWLPGFRGWSGARKATETIKLHAMIFDESGRQPVETIELALTEDFRLFRKELLDLKLKYAGRVRFQTYVKESPATEEEEDV